MFPILHHYELSPFSQKVRSILAYKRIAYHAVRVPAVMPKPDLVALTGGYRRVPVLQMGNHVYCDTALIARVLERISPSPTLYPTPVAELIAEWADTTLFGTAAPLGFRPTRTDVLMQLLSPEELSKMVEDRAAMHADSRRRFLPPAAAQSHMQAYLQRIEGLLGTNEYVCGSAPSIADFSVYHCLWFLEQLVPETLAPFAIVKSWLERMQAIPPLAADSLSSSDALDICQRAGHREGPVSGHFVGAAPGPDGGTPIATLGLRAGQRVSVRASDYGRDAVEGDYAGSTQHDLVIRREDARAGTVLVHFPHVGYEVRAQ
ncbi:MAG TPA: glutathione S-transferase family protein [Polyangiaceae bacterium]|nr:glutathione S-transferase family protein [Polyangiaceae bacterium]